MERKTYVNNVLSYRKQGISLIALLITVIVTLILVTITTFAVKDGIESANVSAFSNDLAKIEDQVKIYYIENRTIPVRDDAPDKMSEDQVTNLVYDKYRNSFVSELSTNGDYSEDTSLGEFYQVDLQKINITSSVAGTKKLGENDVYVVSVPSMNIYYLQGLKARNTIYFSLTAKLINTVNIYSKYDSQITIYNSTISINKSTNTWTNVMPLTIKANIDTDEKLYIRFPGIVDDKEIANTVLGNNEIRFNLSDLFLNNKDLNNKNILVTALTNTEIISFKNLPVSQKYVSLIKKKGNVAIETVKVDLSNYEDVVPTLSNISVENKADVNVLHFILGDNLSGVKAAKYEYLTKLNASGDKVPYYVGITSYDYIYMNEQGKLVNIDSDGKVSINLSKNISEISVLVLDKAGNWIKIDKIAINNP